jgi:predicted aldo/keto reductase-like oxidoreductase
MHLNRRQFIKVAAAAAAALPETGRTLVAGEVSPPDGLPRRILGKTKERVTILGLGCAWLSHDQKTPAARNRVASETHTRNIIEAALEVGIRYFDTAPNYFVSEERLGPALAPVRDEVFLTTKLDHADAKTAEQDLAHSLKLLKTDHVDLLLLHGLGLGPFEDHEALQDKDGALTFLRQAKEKALTRFIGFSSHPQRMTAQRAFATAAGLDVIQCFVNCISRAENHVEQIMVEFARQRDLGVVAMKVLGGDGQLADDYDRAFRYALSVPGVSCALIGASSAAEVKRAAQAAREFRPLTQAELKETIALGQKLHESKSRKAALLRRHHQSDLGNAYC